MIALIKLNAIIILIYYFLNFHKFFYMINCLYIFCIYIFNFYYIYFYYIYNIYYMFKKKNVLKKEF